MTRPKDITDDEAICSDDWDTAVNHDAVTLLPVLLPGGRFRNGVYVAPGLRPKDTIRVYPKRGGLWEIYAAGEWDTGGFNIIELVASRYSVEYREALDFVGAEVARMIARRRFISSTGANVGLVSEGRA